MKAAPRALIVACLSIMLALAGCASNDQTPGGTVGPDTGGTPALENRTSNLQFTGSLTAPFPVAQNPVTGEPIAEGQEGVHFVTHALQVNASINKIVLKLEWNGQPAQPTSIPDLDLYAFDTDGNEVSGLACATGAIPEECAVSDLAAGAYELRVYLFAGGPTDYTLRADVTESFPKVGA